MTPCARCGTTRRQLDAASGWCQVCLNGFIDVARQRMAEAMDIPLVVLTAPDAIVDRWLDGAPFSIPESGIEEQENSMQRVLRWDVPVDSQWHDIGAGPVVLVAARTHRERPGDLVEVWTLEDTPGTSTADLPHRAVTVIGTGHPAPNDTRHIGSAIVPAMRIVPSALMSQPDLIVSRAGLVWHVFERYDPEAERQALAEEGRRLASIREDLIAQGANPDELPVPLHPDPLPPLGNEVHGIVRGAQVHTLDDEATSLAYWLAEHLGEHVDAQDGETLTDTVKRLLNRTNTWPATVPCPDCGHDQVIGYGMRNENGRQVHTHYVCTFYSVDERKACGWHGWSVPGWDGPEHTAPNDPEE